MKKHNLRSNWQIVFMSDTDEQILSDLYEILIVKNLRGSSKLLDVRVKSILTFKICKLISLEYFELSNRSVLVIVASAWFKIITSILVILLRKVFLSVRKLGQWRRKSHVFSTSQPQVQSGFNVSWKLFLNLCS